jgi:hypothetical protein
MSAGAEIAALRVAGIPVDGLGHAKSGYLFVKTTGSGDNRSNVFRWFATSLGKTPGPLARAISEGAPSVF